MDKIINIDKYLTSNLKISIANIVDYSGVYDARIEEVNKNGIYISMPTDKGQPMPARPGMKVEISFISTGGRFSFKTSIKGRLIQRIIMLELERPPFLIKSELREFFRIDVMQKVTIYIMSRDMASGKLVRSDSMQVLCADISGGGARLLAQKPIGGIYDLEVDFSAFIPELNSVEAKVVRDGGARDGKFDIGITFKSLRDSDRDKIVKFVFKRQIEMRMLNKR